MRKIEDKINSILNIFYKSTGMEVFFSDPQLNFISRTPVKITHYLYSILGLNEISSYLAEGFEQKPIKDTTFYTYFLPNNLFTNIVFVSKENEYIGAFITQVGCLRNFTKKEMEDMIEQFYLSAKEKKEAEMHLFKIPVIPYDNIMSIGCVLFELSATLNTKIPSQVICGNSIRPVRVSDAQKNYKKNTKGIHLFENDSSLFDFYLKTIDIVKNGHSEELHNMLENISMEQIFVNKLDNHNFLRALKNSSIRMCSMAGYAAIEAKAPYNKVMKIVDDFIYQMESMESINQIFRVLKNTMMAITNMVSKSNVTLYSKPVHMVMEYIQFHYAEKITLEELAQYTHLSISYLSKQIKKETGMSLNDNINQVRIEKSKELLLNENISILEVAHSVGFVYQNHFASIFKKFMNCTPTSYQKIMGRNQTSHIEDNFSDILPIVMEQLNKTSIIIDFYDMVKIINPIHHTSIKIRYDENEFLIEQCLEWKENNDNSISRKAYLLNQTLFKIKFEEEKIFIVLAIPKKVFHTTYILEIIINTTNRIFIDKEQMMKHKRFWEESSKENIRDGLTGLYNRIYINKMLPLEMRRSILEYNSLYVNLFVIDDLGELKESGSYNEVLKKFGQILASACRNKEDWAGHYAGNIFLVIMYNTSYEIVDHIAKNIKRQFESLITQKRVPYLILNYKIQVYREELGEFEDFINYIIINMNLKGKDLLE